MAKQLTEKIFVSGGYLDSNTSIGSISELKDKLDFFGQSVHMPEAFEDVNGTPYPIDFWSTPTVDGEVKWEIKTLPSINTIDDFALFKKFVTDYKTTLGYFPMSEGFSFIVDGEEYVFELDENNEPIWKSTQNVFDETISDAITVAVEDAVNAVTSGASEAFDTLQEVEAWINENSGKTVDLTGYVKQEDLEGYVKKDELPSMEEYATKDYVDGKVGEIVIPSLEGYATEAWVGEQGFLTEHQDITGKQDVIDDLETIRKGASKGATALQEVPEGYATEAWVGEQGFLTEHQDISGLATKEEVSEAIASIEIPSVEGLATETWVSAEIAKAQLEGEDVDLSGYATKDDLNSLATKEETEAVKTWVNEQGFLTEHQSLEGLATEQFVTDRISEIQIPSVDGFATETWVNEQGFLTEHQDITGKQDVIDDLEAIREGAAKGATALQEIPEEYITNEELEAKGYLTEHQDLSGYATKEEIPTLEGYATESWVSAEIAKAQLEGEDVDLSGYATKDDIKGLATEQFVTDEIAKIEIPTLDGYATEAWVGEQGFLTEHQDISGLATKEEVANAIAEIEIPSVEGLATEQFVTDEIAKIEIPEIDHLATKEELANVSGSIKTVIEDLLIPENAKESLDTLEEISAWIQSHPEDAALMNAQIVALQESAHTHENKGVLDGITADKVAAWDAAEANAKGYTDDEIAKLSDVYAKTTDLEGLATETWVSAEIAKAQLEGEDVDLSGYATKDDLNSLATKEETEAVKTWVNEQGFLTEHQDISGKQDVIDDLETIREGAAKGETALQEVPEGYATETWVNEQGFLTEHQDISGLATKEELANAIAEIEIPSVDGFATETWVNEQGFLTEHQDITGKQDVIDDLETIREGAAKGATALQEVPEGYATETWVGEQGFLTEHQDISGLATKEEVSEAVLSAQTYADSLVENLKPYNGGTAVDVVDYTINVNVAEDGFLEVNDENELTVTGVTLDAAVTSKDITIEGGQWATAVKTVFTGGTVPAGTTWQSFLESMLCVEKFDTSYSMSKAFTVSCGTLGEGITGATNNSSVEVGTKVSLKSFEANPTTASQSYTVSTFDYGYKLGEDGTYNKSTSFKETLTPSLKASNDALTATFTTFVDESGNTIAKISQNTSIPQVNMRVMDGTNKVVIAQTGDTYTSSSAVTAGTIYVATNLKNYYKADKVTPNTYEPKVTPEDKTATASTTYTVTGYRNTFYGTTSKTDAADATFIRTLTKSNKAIAAGNTISFETNSSDGHLRMVIASPRTIKSVKNQTGTQDLTALLVGTKATVSVGGVDNFAPISYNVYDYTWKGAFGNETWIITFA